MLQKKTTVVANEKNLQTVPSIILEGLKKWKFFNSKCLSESNIKKAIFCNLISLSLEILEKLQKDFVNW